MDEISVCHMLFTVRFNINLQQYGFNIAPACWIKYNHHHLKMFVKYRGMAIRVAQERKQIQAN